MYIRNLMRLCVAAVVLAACHSRQPATQQAHAQGPTDEQQELLDQGWTPVEQAGGELGEAYGVRPVYGLQDNYFDIVMGRGCSVAVKVVDAATDRCIRYAYVPENTTVTLNEIPSGLYYLKLAYGKDWMELSADTVRLARFTRDVFYERSTEAYDFGQKNGQSFVNYTLEINVVNGIAKHRFKSEPISEAEFEHN